MNTTFFKIRTNKKAFTLAEVLAAIVIGAMILVAAVGVHSRCERLAAAIKRNLDHSQLPGEVLQRIAEDLDSIIATRNDVAITIQNKLDRDGYSNSRMRILKTYRGKDRSPQKLEEIIWQSNFDIDANSIILYRSHSGIALEDRILDGQKETWEQELFVPICTGITFFKIMSFNSGVLIDGWTGRGLPTGITVTLSFAKPFKTLRDNWEVEEDEQITRTIAINRARKVPFEVLKKEYDPNDPNSPEDSEETDKTEGVDEERRRNRRD